MPVKNMWSLNPGEVLVAEKILELLPDCQVYFPMRDVGIDLLVVCGERHCSVQVKESRYYRYPSYHNSWHQVSETNLRPVPSSKKRLPDYFVFLTYYDNREGTKKPHFEERYLILPTNVLISRSLGKHASKGRGVYSFAFSFEETRVLETREYEEHEKDADYTEFWDNWSQIETNLTSAK